MTDSVLGNNNVSMFDAPIPEIPEAVNDPTEPEELRKPMNVRLTRERIINWGRFSDQTLDFKGGDVLITGINGSGKSIILDSIKLAYVQDAKFNRAAHKASGGKKSDRTILSYVHGDRRAESDGGGILRPGQVVSYVLLEYYNPETDKNMIIGFCYESANMDHLNEICFYYDDAVLEDFTLTENTENGKKELPFAGICLKGKRFTEYRDRSNKPYYTRDNKERNKIISTRLGFKSDLSEIRKVVSLITAFDVTEMAGSGGVSGFCQKNILPEKELKCIGNLVKLNKELDDLQDQLKGFEVKRERLQKVILSIETCQSADRKARTFTLLRKHHGIITLDKEISRIQDGIKSLERKVELLKKDHPILEKEKETAVRLYYEATNNDAYKSFEKLERDCEEKLETLSARLRDLAIEKKRLKELSTKLTTDLDWFVSAANDKDARKILEFMPGTDMDVSDDAPQLIQKLDTLKKSTLSDLRAQAADLRRDRFDCEKKESNIRKKLEKLGNGEIQFLNGKVDMAEMRFLLQREIKIRTNENVEIRIFAELVTEFKDESWRNAVEAYLGPNRYSLIVLDPNKVDIALSVFRELRKETSPEYRGMERCRLVYGDRLRAKADETVVKGSAAELLVTANREARLYANYLLNRIHLCESYQELKAYDEGGLMKDGSLSRGCSEGGVADIKNVDYCLGANALRIQIDKYRQEEQDLKAQIKDLNKQLDEVNAREAMLESVSLRIEDYNFSAPVAYVSCENERAAAERKLDSLRNDPEFVRVTQATEIPKANKDAAENRLRENEQQTSSAEQRIQSEKLRLNDKTAQIETERRQYNDYCDRNQDIAVDVDAKYAEMLRVKNGFSDETGIQLTEARDEARRLMIQAQAEFSSIYPDFKSAIGESEMPAYKKSLEKIENVDIVRCLSKIGSLQEEMDRRYREDYVKELTGYFKFAHRYIRELNKNLGENIGKDRYELVLRQKDEFAPVFNECKRISEGIMFDVAQSDAEFQEYVRDMIEKIKSHEMSEEDYADYRKYFDIRLNIYSFEGGREVKYDFQKKWGSASGGEMNTPLLILLAASLRPLYEDRSARLILLDEAFPDISDDRVRPLMDFLKANNFQTFYCTHKGAGVIGTYVDTCIGCYQVRNSEYSYVEQLHELKEG